MKIDTSPGFWHTGLAFSIVALLITMMPAGCKEKEIEPPPLYLHYTPTRVLQEPDSNSVYAVVEIPAGTTSLQRIDTSGQMLALGRDPIDFLSFPGNYGFIAGCGKMDSVSGQLSPLPVLVMMQALTPESIIQVRPVATLTLKTGSKAFPIVMAIPSDTTLQSIRIGGFVDFITEYDAARHILQQWFLNYQGRGVFDFSGWQDEYYTRQLIADWKLVE